MSYLKNIYFQFLKLPNLLLEAKMMITSILVLCIFGKIGLIFPSISIVSRPSLQLCLRLKLLWCWLQWSHKDKWRNRECYRCQNCIRWKVVVRPKMSVVFGRICIAILAAILYSRVYCKWARYSNRWKEICNNSNCHFRHNCLNCALY